MTRKNVLAKAERARRKVQEANRLGSSQSKLVESSTGNFPSFDCDLLFHCIATIVELCGVSEEDEFAERSEMRRKSESESKKSSSRNRKFRCLFRYTSQCFELAYPLTSISQSCVLAMIERVRIVKRGEERLYIEEHRASSKFGLPA